MSPHAFSDENRVIAILSALDAEVCGLRGDEDEDDEEEEEGCAGTCHRAASPRWSSLCAAHAFLYPPALRLSWGADGSCRKEAQGRAEVADPAAPTGGAGADGASRRDAGNPPDHSRAQVRESQVPHPD